MSVDPTAAAAVAAAALLCWDAGALGAVDLVATTDETLSAELELGTGRTNQNFIANAVDGSGRWFVRIGCDIPAYGVTRAKEQAAGRAAAAAGIAPAVLFTRDDAMVTEFCDGRTLTELELKAAFQGNDNALLDEVAEALRALHAIPPPPELRVLAGPAPASRWAPADMMRQWLPLVEQAGYNRLPIVADARVLIASLEAAAGEPTDSPCFCHYDLLPDNLIRSPAPVPSPDAATPPRRRVSIIDFEYAGMGQWMMDLAIMSMACALTPDEEGSLLRAYTGRPPDSGLQRSFSALKVLACLRETLWGVTAEVSCASALPQSEAISYTDENFAKLTRFRKDFERSEKAV